VVAIVEIEREVLAKSLLLSTLAALPNAIGINARALLVASIVLLWPQVLPAQYTPVQRTVVSQQITADKNGDLYGLYYADCDEEPDCPAVVISGDGKPIPPKANDPDAPTHPGLHVGQWRFPFAWSHFSPQSFSFRTARVGDTVYSFQGRFGHEQVDVISGVPYLEGVLTEMHNGRVLLRKKVHFGHAVIL
jgi:hypothetical protein